MSEELLVCDSDEITGIDFFKSDPPPRFVFEIALPIRESDTRPLPSLSLEYICKFVERCRWDGQCWVWIGCLNDSGYGMFTVAVAPGFLRQYRAHRIAFFLYYGVDPGDLKILHKCDNRRCCNPNHMRLGTQADNVADTTAKGRVASGLRHGTHSHPEAYRGERCGNSKLTETQVVELRQRYELGTITQRKLGEDFGICQQTVWEIVTGKLWKHLLKGTSDVN